MPALSELWGLEESALDTLLLANSDSTALPATTTAPSAGIAMSGDRMLAGACRAVTREIVLQASPDDAWPWLEQLMRGGGIYGWPVLESADCRSAPHLLQGLPPPRLGDQVHRAFILIAVVPERELVWAACEPVRILRHDIPGLTMNYLLQQLEQGSTRLSARLRFTAAGMSDATAARLSDSLELLFIRSQLERLRQCIEDGRARGRQGNPYRHQHALFKPAPISIKGG